MSNYDNRQLRYSCFSEPRLVPHSRPRSLSLSFSYAEWRARKFHFIKRGGGGRSVNSFILSRGEEGAQKVGGGAADDPPPPPIFFGGGANLIHSYVKY